jgi:hypothetical protein
VDSAAASFEVGAMRDLFEARLTGPGRFYDVASDGQRFLVSRAIEERGASAMIIVHNWTAGLRR